MKAIKININFSKELETIFNIILYHKGECRIIGGCVRDYLIQKVPTDFDIATNLDPTTLIILFKKHNVKVIPIGIKYGTIMVIINTYRFEITTLREDIRCFGRHAEIQFTQDWKKDASRRDFTMNAISITPNGELYDYFNGQKDLIQKKVKFIHDPTKRIQEDYLRILRYLRFLGSLGLKNIDDDSYIASIHNIHNLELISRERIKKELMKLLASPFAKEVIIKLNKLNNLQYIGLSSISINNKILQSTKFRINDPLVNLAILSKLSTQNNEKNIALKTSLLLSNKEYQELNILLSFQKQEKFTNLQHYQCLYEYGTELYIRFLFVVNNINKIKLYEEYISKATNSTDITFPLNGRDLQKINITDQEIGKCLKKARLYWHTNSNALNKLKLIQYLEAEKSYNKQK
jgi:poly(A) polymerase